MQIKLYHVTTELKAAQIKSTWILSPVKNESLIVSTNAKSAVQRAEADGILAQMIVSFKMNVHALDKAKLLSLTDYELLDELGDPLKELNINSLVESHSLEDAAGL